MNKIVFLFRRCRLFLVWWRRPLYDLPGDPPMDAALAWDLAGICARSGE
jgi:hypothetical protein